MSHAQLFSLSNFSFLRAASHPHELVAQAHALGYEALALTDECSLAGMVKAHIAARELGLKLLVGSSFRLSNGLHLVALAPNRRAYAELSGFITLARRRADKGSYEAHFDDLRFRLQRCLLLWLPQADFQTQRDLIKNSAAELTKAFKGRLWIALDRQLKGGENALWRFWLTLAQQFDIPLAACPQVLMHSRERKALLDTVMAIHDNCAVDQLACKLTSNAEAYLKSPQELAELYPESLLHESRMLARRCTFSMDELRYQYPRELVPGNLSPIQHLQNLVQEGEKIRWPQGTPTEVSALIKKELQLIEEMQYEYFFLTVHDIVRFARSQNILCQGRGSAANSVVCYCLMITEIAPGQINVLFERFISRERDEPPDIDVDFEHQRREEVIQYIYKKYTRERAALAATVITYRARSAIRDVGKALGFDPDFIDRLAKSLAWWDRSRDLQARIESLNINAGESSREKQRILHFFSLVEQILGFPRHLSQHVGGFIIAQDKVSDLVPLENASMPDRTVIQWDKEDLEAMNLLKVDVLALGMLSALKKAIHYVSTYDNKMQSLADVPREDKATYDMLCDGDSLGVFQVESRAQMSMLPRLKPQCFYDLVIQIAIVRPGPIQGDMVHPYLRRRDGIEAVQYQNDAIKSVLAPTLGVPIFQEQAIRLAMVAAGFSGGEADQLRRAMASWGKNGNLLQFETKFIQGMLANGYDEDFAHRLFAQVKGFGGYGFPESHSASFALLCYASSWFKCHHPAAFYCALLNSQPMGFYSPSQLIQDARRHKIPVLPIDINISEYENTLENVKNYWGIRLGFIRIKGFAEHKAQTIVQARSRPFVSIDELAQRCALSSADLQLLASADALHTLSGNRHQARWQTAAVAEARPLFEWEKDHTGLTTAAPTTEKNICTDFQTTGHSLRVHPLALLRNEWPFSRCKKQSQLASIGNGRFVRVAGLVTGRQRPGTAKGTLFLTLEDETGNINIIVWKNTQALFRQALLSGKLLIINGRLETQSGVIHIIAGRIEDHSERFEHFALQSRDFH